MGATADVSPIGQILRTYGLAEADSAAAESVPETKSR